jgi:hypothetical protein
MVHSSSRSFPLRFTCRDTDVPWSYLVALRTFDSPASLRCEFEEAGIGLDYFNAVIAAVATPLTPSLSITREQGEQMKVLIPLEKILLLTLLR